MIKEVSKTSLIKSNLDDRRVSKSDSGRKKRVRPKGLEPLTARSGVERATICAIAPKVLSYSTFHLLSPSSPTHLHLLREQLPSIKNKTCINQSMFAFLKNLYFGGH